jgi:hypothetical protein
MDNVSMPAAPSETLPEQPPWTSAEWEWIARFLFDVLDDIDTTSDMAKGDENLFRTMVERLHQRRFQVAATDGYRVVFNRLPPPSPTAGHPGGEPDGVARRGASGDI